MLHIVSKPNLMETTLKFLIENPTEGDAVIFIEQAVLKLTQSTGNNSLIDKLTKQYETFVLSSDLQKLGVSNQFSAIKEVHYPDFVNLVAAHKQNHHWL